MASASVVQSVATSVAAIGYSGIGYRTSVVRAVPLSKEDKGEFVEAVEENALSGKYPLSRFLYLYVNYKPNSDLEPLRREFIRYVLIIMFRIQNGDYCVRRYDTGFNTLKRLRMG